MTDSAHFLAMLRERSILREWVDRALSAPDRTDAPGDGTKHYMKRIPEHGDRWLRIIVNIVEGPNKCVTVFFDRRLGRTK
jgi:hypothetical protein